MQGPGRKELAQAREPRRQLIKRLPQRGGVDLHFGEASALAWDAEELNVHGV